MKYFTALLLVTLMVGITGCDEDLDATTKTPDNQPSITGEIMALDQYFILVEENPAGSSGIGKASVALTDSTRILRRNGSAVSAAELQVAQKVSVWFTGPVAQSFPIQATAGVIVIE